MAMDTKLIDKRIVRRMLEQSKVDAAEYRAWLDALPDRADRLIAPPSGSTGESDASRD